MPGLVATLGDRLADDGRRAEAAGQGHRRVAGLRWETTARMTADVDRRLGVDV